MAYYRRAGGYYIDVGGSELIASGEVKVWRGAVTEIVADGLGMADGSFVPADIIVYATGYRPMNEWIGQLISPEVEAQGQGAAGGWALATACDPGPWEGELRNMAGSPPRRRGCGFRAATSCRRGSIRSTSRSRTEGADGRCADAGLSFASTAIQLRTLPAAPATPAVRSS